ncbi:hypothetical protein [Streptococcus devriesei]|uniref:hypothetical protein n=1 Tax=Streptococcus devriesei TaxID=231233 RepID=UPI00042535CE|nr:hypothetical protein [Streptococcus devriesei]
MNTTLDSMAFDNFEAVGQTELSEVDGGGYVIAALAGIAVGVAAVAAAPETAGSSIGVGVKAGVPVALAGLAIHCPGLPAWV